MKTATKATLVVIGTFFVGVAAGASTSDTVTPAAEPEVVTETVSETVTETIEVETAPQACLDAVDLAQRGFGIAGEFSSLMVEYPSLVRRAAEAGMTYDAEGINDITADMERITSNTNELSGRLSDIAEDFRPAVEECEASR